MPHDLKVAVSILSWMADMHAPDIGDTFKGADPPPDLQRRLSWLREVDSGLRVVGFLPVDTSRGEAHRLAQAGLLASDGCGPAYLRVRSKGDATLQMFPRYRLSALGRRWCAAAYRGSTQDHRIAAMIREALQRPDDVPALTARVRPRVESVAVAAWSALVLVGVGLRPLADDALIDLELNKHKQLTADPLTLTPETTS